MTNIAELAIPHDVTIPEFRDAVGRFATGVTVLTTVFNREFHGMTVSSFTSLSLEPLLVVVCVRKGGRGNQLLRRRSVFAVNVLGVNQESISRRFADPHRPAGLDGLPIRMTAGGSPILLGTTAYLDCTVVRRYSGGDHTIVVANVRSVGTAGDVEPLVFHRGRYRALCDEVGPLPTPTRSGHLLVVPP